MWQPELIAAFDGRPTKRAKLRGLKRSTVVALIERRTSHFPPDPAVTKTAGMPSVR